MLIAAKASLNAKDKDGTTALMAASARGHFDVVSTLLAAGANINDQNDDGHTALMFAYNGKTIRPFPPTMPRIHLHPCRPQHHHIRRFEKNYSMYYKLGVVIDRPPKYHSVPLRDRIMALLLRKRW